MSMKIAIAPFGVTQLVSGEEHTKSEGLSNLNICSFYTNDLHMNDLGGGKPFFYCMNKSTRLTLE